MWLLAKLRTRTEFNKMQSRRCNGSSGAHSAAEHSASQGNFLHEIKKKGRKRTEEIKKYDGEQIRL
jgi:hypothetical protein